ncbi:Hypothetical predicted protein [Xyrichtys novacula]|uniref:Uncharacterized protein n=1 Tax=Xyrichtys novacula TaxID=13765 RepID=A0AAV1FY79_XYRNO|nr:Hypothetical predicted protein [Xyrichtys novacula]
MDERRSSRRKGGGGGGGGGGGEPRRRDGGLVGATIPAFQCPITGMERDAPAATGLETRSNSS